MRCKQAREKLNLYNWIQSKIESDSDLSEHLKSCTSCADLARSEKLLAASFESEKITDNEDVISWETLKSQVEQKASRPTSKEYSIMSKLIKPLKHRRRLSISVAMAIVLLAAVTLIPFSYNQTLGYEVAFAGVDKDLAMDSQKIQKLLVKLGINDAKIDVSNCEATCNLIISEIKQAGDAQLIVAAFDKIDNVVLLSEIKEVQSTGSSSLLKQIDLTLVAEKIDNECFTDIEAQNIIISKLGECVEGEYSIWITDTDGECETALLETINIAGSELILCDSLFENDTMTIIVNQFCDDNSNDVADCIINLGQIGESDDFKVIDFKNGQLDADTKQQLEEQGYAVEYITDTDGNDIVILKKETDSGECKVEKLILKPVDEADEKTKQEAGSDDEASAKLGDELPREFSLNQNYPNPFNPTTTISFYLPTSDNVSLDIINMQGQIVKSLLDGRQSAGEHNIEWDATDKNGNKVASGVYLYRIQTSEFNESKKMTLTK